MAVFVANLGGLDPGPSSISSPRTAHSIISVMMSARAGGPRNTHQQKDYPSLLPSLPAITPPLSSPFSLALLSLYLSLLSLVSSYCDLLPLGRARYIVPIRGLMGKMICEQKNKLPENPSMTELTVYCATRPDRSSTIFFGFFLRFIRISPGFDFGASKATPCIKNG